MRNCSFDGFGGSPCVAQVPIDNDQARRGLLGFTGAKRRCKDVVSILQKSLDKPRTNECLDSKAARWTALLSLVAFLGGSPLGNLTSGWLVTRVGSASVMLVVNGTALTLVALYFLIHARGVRDI